MPRPIIHCPSCHRELYHLHTPHCSWCGAEIAEADFALVATPPGEHPVTDLPPLMPQTFYTGYSPVIFTGRLFGAGRSYWQMRNQMNSALVLVMLSVCLLLIPAAYFLWQRQGHATPAPSHQIR